MPCQKGPLLLHVNEGLQSQGSPGCGTQALIVSRETFPERFMEEERKRQEKHLSAVEDALK